MKLVENPEFSKRIKETLLRSNFIAEPDVPQEPITSKSAEPEDENAEENEGENEEKQQPVADIQVLTFLGDKKQEDFRNRLGCYSYTESPGALKRVLGLKNPPQVRWTAYIATSRDAEVAKHSNNLIQGSFEEIADYIYHTSGRVENVIGGTVKSSKPISAINIDIPLNCTEEDKIPNEKELASFCSKLGRSHPLALIISGPQNLVDQYVRKMQEGLTKLKARTFASITVKDGYLCTDEENIYEASESFHRAKKLRRKRDELAKKIETIQENAEDYLETRATYRKLESQLQEQTPEKSEQFHKTIQEASKKIDKFHTAWRDCRWSTQGAQNRQAVLDQDDQLEENIKKWVEATLKGEAEPAVLAESKTLLAKEIVEVFDKIKALQENVIANSKTCYYTPWGLKYFCIGANYYGPEEPLFLSLQSWGDETKLPKIKPAQSSHLMVTSQTGHRTYPTGERELIRNPADFPVLPPEFRKKKIIDGLQTPLKVEEIKIDTRLTARPSIRAELLLETDNLQTQSYNPVTGKPTGIRDASLWRPVITRRGIHHVESMLAPFGYKINCPPEVHNFVERKVKKAERKLAPNYALTPYEALAYYENGPRTAVATIHHPDTGEILWKEGKSYHITPSWRRQTMMVDHSVEDEEQNAEKEKEKEAAAEAAEQNDIVILNGENAARKINNGNRIRTLTERRINYGFATFIVEAEGNKTYEVKETVSHETIGMEKERIATEIEHVQNRIDELEPRLKDKENELSRSELDELRILRLRREEKQIELDTWAPMLEDFVAAFPAEAPPLASEIYGEEIQNASKAIYTRFAPFFQSDNGCTLKDYQLRWASLGSVKRSHLNGSTPGAGKSIMSIMASWRMGHHYNWVICPTIAMKTWAAELDRVGLYHEMVGYRKTEDGTWEERPNVYEHMRQLRDRFHRRERQTNRLGNIEPEYYIISAESVCLGGDGNKVYSPWAAKHPVLGAEKRKKLAKAIKDGELKVPKHWKMWEGNNATVFYIWSDRADSSKEIEDAGFSDFLKPVRFIKIHPVCPKCEASKPVWTRHGFCNKCGHRQSAITQIPAQIKLSNGRDRLKCATEHITPEKNYIPEKADWTGGKKSLRQYPLYKMMGKHVGCKIIDEVHNWANFHSQHGAALQQVKSKDSIILSGTLCKTHIRELEPSLCQVYEPNSGEFPYSPWGMALFKEQFETIEIESVYRETQGIRTQVRRRNSEKVVPEASNLTKLRALMHGVMCSVGENEMERVWGIKPIHEHIRYVELQPENAAIHQDWARMLREAAADCKTQQERIGLLRKARNQLTNLAYACDGPEKLNATVEWIREGMERGERSTIVGPSTKFYMMLCKRLKELKIPFMALGNTPPEKRYEVLNKFRDSKCPNFVSRIRLINVNFNQLTCCTRILFTGIDPSPSALRQMQKRLNRIGQTKDVHCTFLISQMPPDRPEPVSTHPLSVFNQPIDLEETESEEPELERAPSYEERLFALVLRRETAIKQTLQQADRQRDPQELYELLKDRQTLNQLLEDIIQDTKTDPEIQQKIKEMADSGKAVVAKPKMPKVEKPERKKTPTPPEDDLPAPKGYQFTWTPPKKKFPNVLQGELFSL